MIRSKLVALSIAVAISPLPGAALAATPAPAATAPPSAPAPKPDGFPRTAKAAVGDLTVYQPQVESWDGYRLVFHAACSVLPPGAKEPTFGVLTVQGTTQVDKPARSVLLYESWIEKASFPSAPDKADAYKDAFSMMLPADGQEIALDRLESQLLITKAEVAQATQPVKNDPPKIVFSQTSAVLVHIDGDPVWVKVEGTAFERVVNTHALILRNSPQGDAFLHLLGGWMEAVSVSGTWFPPVTVPAGFDDLAAKLAKDGVVDLMDAQAPSSRPGSQPTLASAKPSIIIATRPTELIVTEGPIDWMPLEGTNLLYVRNTTGNVFLNMSDQTVYVLISGRWFHAASVAGPWTFTAPAQLPSDFAHIPDDSPKENVKATIPGTVQAKEAVIAAQIPQTAVVYPDKMTFKPDIAGDPVILPVDGTALSYVANSPEPIVEVGPMQWYAVQSGVWFTATSLKGPWQVAMSVPPAIYTIPTSSPIHYATYVQIYDATPTYVVVGYTTGYTGTVITPYGTVVYGTGYVYPAYIGGTVWIAPPPTYGYAVGMTYTPWTGWTYGYGMGWGWGSVAVGVGIGWAIATTPCWGPMPYYYHPYSAGVAVGYGGAAVWGPSGWASTTGNVYSHYGSTSCVTRSSAGYNAWTGNAWSSEVGRSYNSTTGQRSVGQTASASNAYTGGYANASRGATYNPSTGVAAAGSTGTVGNTKTGQSASYARGAVSGPGGNTTSVGAVSGSQGSAAHVGNNYYASNDGNVYKYNSQTGQTQQYNKDGSWSNASSEKSQWAGQQASAQSTGESRSFGGDSSSYGSGSHSYSGSGSGSYGGGDHSYGGGGGGGWGGGGGDHSFGGGGWGGGGGGGWGGFHGGGGRR